MQPLTRRDVIEMARDRLIEQGAFAKTSSRGCAYKNAQGHRCAVGILPGFPVELENSSSFVHQLFMQHEEFRAMFAPDVTADFLQRVQHQLHDTFTCDDEPFDGDKIRKAADLLLETERV